MALSTRPLTSLQKWGLACESCFLVCMIHSCSTDFGYHCCVCACLCLVDQMRQYITQLRQEVGVRLVEKVYGSDRPSKVSNYHYHSLGRGGEGGLRYG